MGPSVMRVVWSCGTGAVGVQVPPAEVDLTMVGPAQADQVPEVGGTAFGPGPQVVDLATLGRHRTAGHDAATIARREGAPLRGRRDALGSSHRHGLGGAQHVLDQAGQLEPPRRGRVVMAAVTASVVARRAGCRELPASIRAGSAAARCVLLPARVGVEVRAVTLPGTRDSITS
jgi:hypothetical protein